MHFRWKPNGVGRSRRQVRATKREHSAWHSPSMLYVHPLGKFLMEGRRGSMDTGARTEAPALIASMPASAQQRRVAFGVIIFLSVVFAIVVPVAPKQVARLDVFIPVIQSLICFADLITAVFLFAQYSIQPQRALLALASGYIFSGLFAFLQTLDFPGAYSATGLLGGNPSGAAWLFSFWHIMFPLCVIAYVLLKDRSETPANSKNKSHSGLLLSRWSVYSR